MKKIYVSPTADTVEMELTDMLAESLAISDEETEHMDARQMLIFNLMDE